MLKLKHKHLPKHRYYVERPNGMVRMQFATPKLDAHDEMARAIMNDDEAHDNKWELNERPDAEKLVRFWSKVLTEAREDPNWTFVDEREE